MATSDLSGCSLPHSGEAQMQALAHRSSSSAWGTWTSTMSTPDAGVVTAGTSGGICSMGNPGMRGAEPLKVLGGESADPSHEDN